VDRGVAVEQVLDYQRARLNRSSARKTIEGWGWNLISILFFVASPRCSGSSIQCLTFELGHGGLHLGGAEAHMVVYGSDVTLPPRQKVAYPKQHCDQQIGLLRCAHHLLPLGSQEFSQLGSNHNPSVMRVYEYQDLSVSS
jgi:hypothetical protein